MKLSEVFGKSRSSTKEEKKAEKQESDSPSGSGGRRKSKKGAAAAPDLRGERKPAPRCIHNEYISDNTEYPGTPISKTSSGSSSDPKTSPAPEKTAQPAEGRKSSDAAEASGAENSLAQPSSQDTRPAMRSHFGFHAPFRSYRAAAPPYTPAHVPDPAVQPGTSRPIVYVGGHWTGGHYSAVPF